MAYTVQSYKFHSRVVNDLSDLVNKHDNLKLTSTGVIYADSTCQNPLEQPISLELSVLGDLRVLAAQEITVQDVDGYEIYKSVPVLIEDSNIANDGDTSVLWEDIQNKPDFPSSYLGIGANAVSASKLFTARTINGVTFDGTANISFNSDAVAEGTTNKYYTDARVGSYLTTIKNIAGGVAGLDASGKVPVANLPAGLVGAMIYQGSYNAYNDSPTLPDPTTCNGYYWIVDSNQYNNSGSTYIAGLNLKINDWVVSNGTSYQKIDNQQNITSVFGRTGAVTLTADDIAIAQGYTSQPSGDYMKSAVGVAPTSKYWNAIASGAEYKATLGLLPGPTSGLGMAAGWVQMSSMYGMGEISLGIGDPGQTENTGRAKLLISSDTTSTRIFNNLVVSGTITAGGTTVATTANLAGYSPLGHTHLWAEITDRPTNLSSFTNGPAFISLTSPITGYAVGTNAALAATDTVLGAFNKIQAQLNAKQASGSYLTGNQTITVSGDATGSGTTAIALTLASTGVTAGTYAAVGNYIPTITVDAKGRVTGIANMANTPAWSAITGKPTTLAGYGITDAQANLGFYPVQQGGGTSQTTNKVYIGWSSGAALRVQVDSTDFGSTWPIAITGSSQDSAKLGGQLPAYYVNTSDSRLTDARTPLAHTHTISSLTDNDALVQGASSNTGALGKRTVFLGGTAGILDGGLKSGFYDVNGSGSLTGNWLHVINSAHNNSYTGNVYQFQIAASFSNSKNQAWGAENYYVRTITAGGTPDGIGAWRTLWHSGNLTGDQTAHYHSADRAWANLTGVPATVQNPGSYYVPLAGGQLNDNALIISYGSGAGGLSTVMKNSYYPNDQMSVCVSAGYIWWGRAGTSYASATYTGNATTGDVEFTNLNGGFKFNDTVTFANGTWNAVGDDAAIGDINEGATLGLSGRNVSGSYLRFCNNGAANGVGINQGYKIGYNGTDFALFSGATQIVRTDTFGKQFGLGFEGYIHNGVSAGVTGNTYGGQWLALCTLTVTGQYGSASATFDVSNAYGTGSSGNWYSYKGTIKIKQQSAMSAVLDMCKIHIINCEGSYNPWTQIVAVVTVDNASEKRVVLYALSPWSYDSIRLKVENYEGNVLYTGIGAWAATLPAGTSYTATSSIRWDSSSNTLHANDNIFVGFATSNGTNSVGRIASNLNNTNVASFIGNWNSNGYWGIAGSYVANDYRIRITRNDSMGTITDWANLGAGTITSHNIAEMSKWGINGAYAFFGLAGGNTTSWATSNGVGVGAGEIWLSNPSCFRVAIGTKTDALNMTATSVSFGMPIYSNELHAGGSYAGTGLFAGTGDGASLTTYNQKITSWYGTGIYDACNNVCTGYIDNRLGKLYLKGDIVTEKWVYAAKFVGPIDASGGSVTVGSLTGTAGAYFTNGCSAAFFTSGVSTISAAGTYLGYNYNNIIAVTVAGVTIAGAAQGRVQYIVNVSGSTVAFNMAGGGYYYAGSATTGTVSIPSKRTLAIIPVASTTDVYTYLM